MLIGVKVAYQGVSLSYSQFGVIVRCAHSRSINVTDKNVICCTHICVEFITAASTQVSYVCVCKLVLFMISTEQKPQR
jgi:hypothetical protein